MVPISNMVSVNMWVRLHPLVTEEVRMKLDIVCTKTDWPVLLVHRMCP